jgi:hypothetical protein
MPTARTNGAAKGSRIGASSAIVARARAAAAVVAVTPTLVLGSQVSRSVRCFIVSRIRRPSTFPSTTSSTERYADRRSMSTLVLTTLRLQRRPFQSYQHIC